MARGDSIDEAPDGPVWIPSCTGKQAFPNRGAAQHVADRMRSYRRRGGRKDRTTAHAYRCPACGNWHVGNDHSKGRKG